MHNICTEAEQQNIVP